MDWIWGMRKGVTWVFGLSNRGGAVPVAEGGRLRKKLVCGAVESSALWRRLLGLLVERTYGQLDVPV